MIEYKSFEVVNYEGKIETHKGLVIDDLISIRQEWCETDNNDPTDLDSIFIVASIASKQAISSFENMYIAIEYAYELIACASQSTLQSNINQITRKHKKRDSDTIDQVIQYFESQE